MLIKFESQHSGTFSMFDKVAEPLLRLMGMSGNLQGGLREQDIPQALAKLEAGLAPYKEAGDSEGEDDDGEQSVGIATHAVPLLNMLRREVAEGGGYVMWRPQ